jgi:hypothetical protein
MVTVKTKASESDINNIINNPKPTNKNQKN